MSDITDKLHALRDISCASLRPAVDHAIALAREADYLAERTSMECQTGIQPVLVEQIAELMWDQHHPDCPFPAHKGSVVRESYLVDARVVLDAITTSPRHVLVELPDQMTDRSYVADVLRPLPMWETGDAWTCLREPGLIEFEADSQNAHGDVPTTGARALAAALLAAERFAAESGSTTPETRE